MLCTRSVDGVGACYTVGTVLRRNRATFKSLRASLISLPLPKQEARNGLNSSGGADQGAHTRCNSIPAVVLTLRLYVSAVFASFSVASIPRAHADGPENASVNRRAVQESSTTSLPPAVHTTPPLGRTHARLKQQHQTNTECSPLLGRESSRRAEQDTNQLQTSTYS